MNFVSDNVAGCAGPILDALLKANEGVEAPYGEDSFTLQLRKKAQEVFECDLDIFPIATGTAANSVAIAAMTPAWGGVYCHDTAHIHTTECNAPEFYSNGAKLLPVSGADYKISSSELTRLLSVAGFGKTNKAQPSVLSLTQPSDYGTVYRNPYVEQLSAIAKSYGLGVHMDGARFANALAFLGCTPAEASWKAGVDILTLGATKNGAMFAEAIIVFNKKYTHDLGYLIRRGGHVWSKMRYASAQLIAYLDDGYWMSLGRSANDQAADLAAKLAAYPFVKFLAPVEANILQVDLPSEIVDELQTCGYKFYRRSKTHIRLLCRYDTDTKDIDSLVASIGEIFRKLQKEKVLESHDA